jgi:hypothetical protein
MHPPHWICFVSSFSPLPVLLYNVLYNLLHWLAPCDVFDLVMADMNLQTHYLLIYGLGMMLPGMVRIYPRIFGMETFWVSSHYSRITFLVFNFPVLFL